VFPFKKGSVLVAIPAYNEEARIENVVQGCLNSGADVCVIDDGSSDATSGRVQKLGASVIRHDRNQGKGMAIRTALHAFAESTYEYLILMDADGQHDPAFIPSFVERASNHGVELLLGNRMLSTSNMPTIRKWTNQFTSRVISCVSGQRIPDSQCGYRLLSRKFAQQFRPTTFRFDLESEMLIQAGRLGFKIDSLPISTVYEGQSSHIHPFWDTLRFIRLILKYLWR
jgi:glycosyltransferase involved in cell wall biosynthesis